MTGHPSTRISLTVHNEPVPSDAFGRCIRESTGHDLRGALIHTVQVNIGLRCNLACRHCHVESSPKRTEEMDWPTMEQVLRAAQQAGAGVLDITGGAPEMHPHFRRFVEAAHDLGMRVMVRTNLVILLEDGYAGLPEFFKTQRIHLVASLPCYLQENVDRQRGRGVYDDSIEAIRRLNGVGYGTEPELPLDLVYNPVGAGLPPPQAALEADYRHELDQRFGIRFTRLLTITNMAIGRFLDDLVRQGKAEAYVRKLRDAFNPATVDGLMCRHQLHVGWDGTLYDCDFNFAMGIPVGADTAGHVSRFDPESFLARRIVTGEHCFGCTAGAGSSCGGALQPQVLVPAHQLSTALSTR